jgi:hypothetical protein
VEKPLTAEDAKDAEVNKIWDSGIQDLGIDSTSRRFDPILQSGSRILNPNSSIPNPDIDSLRGLCVLRGEEVLYFFIQNTLPG